MHYLKTFKRDFFKNFFDDDFNKLWYATIKEYQENDEEKNDMWFKLEDGSLILELEVPGFTPETLKINVSENLLTVNGEREIKHGNVCIKKTVNKQFHIGKNETVEAEMKDGILYITVKKPEVKNEVKNIEIKC